MALRVGPIWKIERELLSKYTAESDSFAEILRKINISIVAGRNLHTLKQRLIEEKIDFSHIAQGLGSNKNKSRGHKFIPKNISEYLKINTEFTSSLRRRLFREKILKQQCSECKIPNEWNGKKLTLHIDHVNGNRSDNRIENLRVLCPNCHAQTDTYCRGKSLIAHGDKKEKCKVCNAKISRKNENQLCVYCSRKQSHKESVPNINIEEIKKSVKEVGYLATGKKYNVSDVTIRNWITRRDKSFVGSVRNRNNQKEWRN